jgi:hypothetical protein
LAAFLYQGVNISCPSEKGGSCEEFDELMDFGYCIQWQDMTMMIIAGRLMCNKITC